MCSALTEEQRIAVEANLKLAYYYYNKLRKPSGIDADDWQQECLVSLCHAIQKHDPERGALTTVLKSLILNQMTEARRRFAKESRFIPDSQIHRDEIYEDLIPSCDPDLSSDHRDELDSIIGSFCPEWADPIINMAESYCFNESDIALLNKIRSGFGVTGKVAQCLGCSILLVRTKGSHNVRYCTVCANERNREKGADYARRKYAEKKLQSIQS